MEKIAVVDYAQYIKSPQWRIRREQMLRLQPLCQRCGSDRRLHVHHTNYDNLGNETRSDLIVLCKDCHFGLHDGEILVVCGESVSPYVIAQEEITEAEYVERKR